MNRVDPVTDVIEMIPTLTETDRRELLDVAAQITRYVDIETLGLDKRLNEIANEEDRMIALALCSKIGLALFDHVQWDRLEHGLGFDPKLERGST